MEASVNDALTIEANLVKGRLDPAQSGEEMLRAAFKAVQGSESVLMWGGDDDFRLRAALGGVLLAMADDHPDRERVQRSIDFTRAFNAFLRASQAGLSCEIPEVEEGLYPLVGWFLEAQGR